MLPQIFLDACETAQAREFLTCFLSDFPAEYQPYLCLHRFAPHEILISSAAVSSHVFILLSGTLCAMESRVQNQPFVFAKLYPGAIVGDYELFAQTEESYATILSLQKSVCLRIPADIYLAWISRSTSALLCRLQALVRQLGNQTMSDRQYFYMDYEARCISVLLQTQPASQSDDAGRLLLTREELAGKIGCSLRTCHRLVQHLADAQFITLCRGKITLNDTQRGKLQQYLEQKIENL